MFERIALHNFRSFENLEFDLSDRSGTPKHLAIIFGDNGIGKTNLAFAFNFLSETLHTMDVRDIMQSIFNATPDAISNERLSKIIHSRYRDLETIIKENKLVESEDSMKLDFYFKIAGKRGRYILETNDQQIIHEQLEYTLSQNKGVYFEITPENCSINPKIFTDKKTLKEILSAHEKYWGKHSLLSIILHEIADKADLLVKAKLSEHFQTIINFMTKLSIKSNLNGIKQYNRINLLDDIVGDVSSGNIPASKERILNKIEDLLNHFFPQINNDIVKVFYTKTYKEDKIIYQLHIAKRIAQKVRNLDFSMESSGTKSLLYLLPYMLKATAGVVVVIDEFDIGLHDALTNSLIESLSPILSGQLIITTHGTQIMKNNALKDNIYIIQNDDDGTKRINCITYYDKKIAPNTNIRNQYFDGKYGSLPQAPSIDFKPMIALLNH